MSPIRRQGERIERPEKSIGTAGALRSDGAEAAAGERDSAVPASSGRGVLFKLGVTLCVICALLLAGLAGFAAYHWAWGDDAQDIQGTWYVNGTPATISIGEGEIVLTDEVSYGYELDSFSKTIDLHFGKLSGGGRYRFSLDRGELAIIDGDYTWTSSFTSDLAWIFCALFGAVQGKDVPPAEGDQVTLLSRELPGVEPVEPAGSAESSDPAAPAEPASPDASGAGEAASGEAASSDGASAADAPASSGETASAEGDASANEPESGVSDAFSVSDAPAEPASQGNGE